MLFRSIMNILRQTAMISVAAVGMTFAISAGLIDLSTGSVVAMSALTTALMLRVTGWIPAAICGLLVGFVSGFLNGIVVAKVRIPAFLVTLGTSSVFAGIARTMTNLEAVPIINANFNFIFGSGDIGPISTLFLWTIVIMILGHILYRKTSDRKSVV